MADTAEAGEDGFGCVLRLSLLLSKLWINSLKEGCLPQPGCPSCELHACVSDLQTFKKGGWEEFA